jgi:hypothetical protein
LVEGFYNCRFGFSLGVRADVQPKSRIPIGAKVEIGTQWFTPGVKAEIEKIFSICPKLLINGELYGLVLASRLKTGYLQPSPWGQCSSIYQYPDVNVLAFISNFGPIKKPKMLKLGPESFQPLLPV